MYSDRQTVRIFDFLFSRECPTHRCDKDEMAGLNLFETPEFALQCLYLFRRIFRKISSFKDMQNSWNN